MTSGHPLDLPDEYIAYLEEYWSILAACAWEGYSKKGRGFIWVDWDNILLIPNKKVATVPAMYVPTNSPLKGELLKLSTPRTAEGLERLIKQYPPNLSVVIYFFSKEGNRIRTACTGEFPPQAYENNKDRLSNFVFNLRDLQCQE
ncbi:MAG TPA: hypothetical protein V6D29_11195 [Leptolyngbyaceae cyanobacterium]